MSFQPVSFGKYELVSRLAAGGMAEIFLARTKAIQGFEKISSSSASCRTRTQRSRVRAHVPRRGAHRRDARPPEHRADLRRRRTSTNEYFIAMEYLRGHNLQRDRPRAARSSATPSRRSSTSCRSIARCCAGLHYAHEQARLRRARRSSIVHRDVTPQNIVVTFDGGVKVVDFGIAKAATREVETLRRHAQGQDRRTCRPSSARGAAGRSPQRHLRRRHHAVRADHRQAPLSRALGLRDAQEDHRRAGAVAARPPAVLSRVLERDRRALSAEEPRRPLSDRARPPRRPRRVRARQPAGHRHRAAGAVHGAHLRRRAGDAQVGRRGGDGDRRRRSR